MATKKTVTEEMEQELEKMKAKPVANLEMNYFEEYGSQVMPTALRGQLLKFSKGDWLYGRDETDLAVGTKLVANMSQLLIGWVKWSNNRPEQQLMGLLEAGFRPAQRADLGDQDEDKWEVDNTGKPRDPWQYTNYLILKDEGQHDGDDSKLLTFVTSSRGGIGCIGDLCSAYGRHIRVEPNKFPVIELGVDSYKHPNPEFGRIKVPKMIITGWEDKQLFEVA